MGVICDRKLVQTSQFKTDFKKIARSGRYKIDDFEAVVRVLITDDLLPSKYKDHLLIGDWVGFRECHIKPDWLLIYKKTKDEVVLVRTGSHSDLFC